MRFPILVAVLLCAGPAFAQQAANPVQLFGSNQQPVSPVNPLATSDSNYAARVLTPSGTAGVAGTIAGAPYPATSGGSAASVSNTGKAFTWVCTTAGLGSITLTDGSVLPFSFATAGGIGSPAKFAIIDAEPGTGSGAASGCTFAVLR